MLPLAERILVAVSRAEPSRTGADTGRRHYERLHAGDPKTGTAPTNRDRVFCGDVAGSVVAIVLCDGDQPSKKRLAFFFVRFQLVLRDLSIIQATDQLVFYSGGLHLIARMAHSVGVSSESS
jgi:hypothetical protein